MSIEFYSARLLLACLVNDGRPKKKNLFEESVIVFRARDFNHAFKRALELGKSQNQTYKNQYGQKVRWVLVDIVNLDLVGKKVDGKEVASKLHHRTQAHPIPTNKKFHPEKSKPTQTF